MEKNTRLFLEIVVVVLAVASIAVSSAALIVANDNHPEPQYEKYTIYIGTDYGNNETELTKCQEHILKNLVTPHTTGYTSYLAKGCSFSGSTPIPADGTIVLVIGMVEHGKESMITDIVKEIAEDCRDHLEAILVEKGSADYQLFVA